LKRISIKSNLPGEVIQTAAQIPRKLQDQLGRFEQIKTQLQMTIAQRNEMDARKRDLESAISALESRKDGDVYRRAGELLLKVEDVPNLLSSLKDDLETATIRLNSVEKQEKSLREMYDGLGKELNEALKEYQ
jgi:prefoldin beta subunit